MTIRGNSALSRAIPASSISAWSRWGRLNELPINFSNPATAVALGNPVLGGRAWISTQYDDAFRYVGSIEFKPIKDLTLRLGGGYDESPVPNPETRSVRLPDNDRYWFSLGATYQASKASRFDVGYTFINVKDADINNTQPGVGTVNGTYEATVNILSIQYQHTF